ncbi:MAG: hypothetical protein UV38_C0002G0092 [candidate division TM6 bacterium GW2011_GWE2_42_60]|nr:MAG: hypothetical protein UV38_C0002G0092 [candidate division TM6 bacterium GW2011_GWE2_42_60]
MNEQENKKNGVVLSERELSQVVVVLLLGALFIFLAGYFIGKKRMCEELSLGDEVRFADKIQHALTNLANRTSEFSEEAPESESEVEDDSSDERDESEISTTEKEPEKTKELVGKAYAQLCGFSTESTAKAYVARLKKRGIASHVAERTSRTARGKKVIWYQVLTETMDRAELSKLVQSIKQRDKLASVTIVAVSE